MRLAISVCASPGPTLFFTHYDSLQLFQCSQPHCSMSVEMDKDIRDSGLLSLKLDKMDRLNTNVKCVYVSGAWPLSRPFCIMSFSPAYFFPLVVCFPCVIVAFFFFSVPGRSWELKLVLYKANFGIF